MRNSKVIPVLIVMLLAFTSVISVFGTGLESGSKTRGPVQITEGTYNGTLNGSLPDDYNFRAGKGMIIDIDVWPLNAYYSLFNSDGDDLFTDMNGRIRYSTTYEDDIDSVFMIRVYTSRYHANLNYTLELGFGQQHDAGSGVDAPGNERDPIPITGGMYHGELMPGDEIDVYEMDYIPGSRIDHRLITRGNIRMRIRIPTEGRPYDITVNSTGPDQRMSSFHTGNISSYHPLLIFIYGSGGEYGFEIINIIIDESGSGNDIGDNMNNAYPVEAGYYTGTLGELDRNDVYSIEAGDGNIITIYLNHSLGNDVEALLYELNPKEPIRWHYTQVKVNNERDHESYCTKNGSGKREFLVAVIPLDSTPEDTEDVESLRDYGLGILIERQNETGNGNDAGNDIEHSWMIEDHIDVDGDIDQNDKFDIFKFGLEESMALDIRFDSHSAGILEVDVNFGNTTIHPGFTLQDLNERASIKSHNVINIIESIDYRSDIGVIVVRAAEREKYDHHFHAGYDLEVQLTYQNDSGTGQDVPPPYSPLDSPYISDYISGYLSDQGDQADSYIVNLSRGERLRMTLEEQSREDMAFQLEVSYRGNLIDEDICWINEGASVDITAEETASYTVTATVLHGHGHYDLSINIYPLEIPDPVSEPMVIEDVKGKYLLIWDPPAEDSPMVDGYAIKVYDETEKEIIQNREVGPSTFRYLVDFLDRGHYSFFVTAFNSAGSGDPYRIGFDEKKTEDQDLDLMPDHWEQSNGLDHRDPEDACMDHDGDGFNNLNEYIHGTDPLDASSVPYLVVTVENRTDSDGDGMPDDWEEEHGLDRFDSGDLGTDPDEDGSSNLMEFLSGTDPMEAEKEDDENIGMWIVILVVFMGVVVSVIVNILILGIFKLADKTTEVPKPRRRENERPLSARLNFHR